MTVPTILKGSGIATCIAVLIAILVQPGALVAQSEPLITPPKQCSQLEPQPDLASATLPNPAEMDYFTDCACDQKGLPPPGQWRMDVRSGISQNYQEIGEWGERQPFDEWMINRLSDTRVHLRRDICGAKLEFITPGPILHPYTPFEAKAASATPADGGRDYLALDRQSKIRFEGHLDFSRRGQDIVNFAQGRVIWDNKNMAFSDATIELRLQKLKEPGLTEGGPLQRVTELTGRSLESWNDLPCWCKEVERSYRVSYANRRSFSDPALLSDADALGVGGRSASGERLSSIDVLDRIEAGELGPIEADREKIVVSEGRTYSDRVYCVRNAYSEETNATVRASQECFARPLSGVPPEDLNRDLRTGRAAAKTDFNTCKRKVPDDRLPVYEAMLHVHEMQHERECCALNARAAEIFKKRIFPSVFGNWKKFADVVANTPDATSRGEIEAYTAGMIFLDEFYQAHCRPIVEHFD